MLSQQRSPSPGEGRQFRGKNKQPAWQREKDAPFSVIRLPLVVDDPAVRHRLEHLFTAVWQVKKALQRDAGDAVDAYWGGDVRREADTKAWRTRLGLSRTGMERRAYAHLERSVWLADHVSKALVMHLADAVWTGVERHLFPDASGQRAGRPKTGSWWEFTRIAGRARSHTTERKWETFRLHGSLAGHLATFRHPHLPPAVTDPAQAAALAPGMRVLAQPRYLAAPARPTGRIPTGTVDARGRDRTRTATWHDHTGPLTVVWGGGPTGSGEITLPVRLPQGAGRWPYLVHYLDRPSTWHKIDLVRRRDLAAPGGWAYEAHLLVLDAGHASPATRERRARAACLERIGGIDGNVSNLAVVSLPASLDPDDGPVRADHVTLTKAEQQALAGRRKKERGRQKALDRSRRATNPKHYQPSHRQQARNQRRQAAGLKPRTVLPAGPRHTDASGRPRQAYHHDVLSNSYRTQRVRHQMAAACAAEASHQRAKKLAARLIAAHGPHLTVEDCDIRTWFRLWGKACAATSPGRLIAALAAECTAAGGRLLRASTFTTALSQHCLCGRRTPKSLRERIHYCEPAQGGCGLRADRDLTAAALALFTTLANPNDPATASVNYSAARAAQIRFAQGLQEALSESTAPKPAPPGRTPAAAHRRREVATSRPRQASARRSAGLCTVATPAETRPANERPKAHTVNDTTTHRLLPYTNTG